jgi:hypothetical protein
VRRLLPVYPDQRTSSDRPGMSQTCQTTKPRAVSNRQGLMIIARVIEIARLAT